MTSISYTENITASLASRFINNTGCHIFLTGKAGTGKTTFLKYIISHTHKNVVVAAPTGIAAINAGGVTLHSLFQLPFGGFIPTKEIFQDFPENIKLNTPQTLLKNLQLNSTKRKLLQEIDLLIIDEVSMLRADLLDAIDVVLRSVRKKHHVPFGGLQILFIGDLLQLPPVVKEDEWRYLQPYYNSPYFFDALALQQNKPLYIEFDKIYRQQDDAFIRILNNLRTNEITPEDIEILNEHYHPGFNANAAEGYINLTTHNAKADRINREELQKLEGESFYFKAIVTGDFSPYAYPIEETLELKKGAQVMFIKNDPSGEKRFFNGKIGFISDIDAQKIEVTLDDFCEPIKVDRYTWLNNRYKLNEATNEVEEEEAGAFTQYPIRLAWAITIHKSQGLTFTKAIIDVGSAFVSGQAYVALSRLVSLDGLVLSAPVRVSGLSPSSNIVDYANNRISKEKLPELLDHESQGYLRDFLVSCFDFSELHLKLAAHIASYKKDEGKSNKQKHRAWAIGLKGRFEETMETAAKFQTQIQRIFDAQSADYKEHLKSRVGAAKTYFGDLISVMNADITKHKELVKIEKKVRKYLTELTRLQDDFLKQVQFISRAEAMLDSAIGNEEFSKEKIRIKPASDQLSGTSEGNPDPEKETRGRKRKSGSVSPGINIPNTKQISYELFTGGKTIIEIAEARDMAPTTIERHLAHYVGLGYLQAEQFVSPEKIEPILAAAATLEKPLLSAIKEILGDEYSYSDIRFAIAGKLKDGRIEKLED